MLLKKAYHAFFIVRTLIIETIRNFERNDRVDLYAFDTGPLGRHLSTNKKKMEIFLYV